MTGFAFFPVAEPYDNHPAATAWREVSDTTALTTIEELRTKRGKRPNRKSMVFRLSLTGGGTAVIAKRSNAESIETERLIYQDVLPRLGVDHLECHAALAGTDGVGWLFVEAAAGAPFHIHSPSDQELACSWISQVHARSRELDLAATLPEHGPARYARYLDQIPEQIDASIERPWFTDDARSTLRSVAETTRRVATRWPQLCAIDAALPKCLVHGDYVPKNVFVCAGARRPVLAFDWDIAGWGSPGVDIDYLDRHRYQNRFRHEMPDVSDAMFDKMALVGRILRCLGLINATCQSLQYEWVDDALRDIDAYHRALLPSIDALD